MPRGIIDLFIQQGEKKLCNMMKSDKYQEIKDNPPPQLFTCQTDFKFQYAVCIFPLHISRCQLIIEPFDNPSTRNLAYSNGKHVVCSWLGKKNPKLRLQTIEQNRLYLIIRNNCVCLCLHRKQTSSSKHAEGN